MNLQALVIVFHSWLFREPSLASLRLCEFRLFVFGQPEQSLFTPHDRLSSLPSSLRCASRGIAEQNINVREMNYRPTMQALPVQQVEVTLTLETRNHHHLEQLLAVLDEQGYAVTRVQGPLN